MQRRGRRSSATVRVRWATTCEAAAIDDRGAYSLAGVGANVLQLAALETRAHTPLFIALSVPRHELDSELEVAIVVADPRGRPVGSQTHLVSIPSAELPAGWMDGYEVPAYLSTVVNFDVADEGAYSVFITPPLRTDEPPPEPLTVFVVRLACGVGLMPDRSVQIRSMCQRHVVQPEH